MKVTQQPSLPDDLQHRNESRHDEFEQARNDKWAKAVAQKNRDMQNFGPRPNDTTIDYDKNDPVPNPIGEGKATSEIGDFDYTGLQEPQTFWLITSIAAACFSIGFLLGAIIF